MKVCNDASLITTSTVKAPIIEIPAEGTLYVKAFPNPFSSNASIRFMVHKEDRVELKLYDILGREQAIIYRGKLDAGKMYQVNFDGKELSKGIYFLKLTTGNGAVHQEKLIISR